MITSVILAFEKVNLNELYTFIFFCIPIYAFTTTYVLLVFENFENRKSE